MAEQPTSERRAKRGEGFAFFRWHWLRYQDLYVCDGCKNPRNLCVAYWTGNVR